MSRESRLPELRPLSLSRTDLAIAPIVGEMGYGKAASITAIDAVNTASRLETLTKNFACAGYPPV